jgi:hypothetical protein
MEVIAIILVLLLVFGFATYPFLPKVLGELRLYRCMIPDFDLKGRRALIICTSYLCLDPTDRTTGAFGSEFTVAFYAFLNAGMEFCVASIKGGETPIQPLCRLGLLSEEMIAGSWVTETRWRRRITESNPAICLAASLKHVS